MKNYFLLLTNFFLITTLSAVNAISLKNLFQKSKNIYNFEEIVPLVTVENYITQKLDHFDKQNNATFEQLFYMNGEYFQPGGPVILLLGGNDAILPWRLLDTLPGEITRTHNGYIFYLEHRFYGQSIPMKNVTNENLRYLSIDQALADIAHFISYIKSPTTIPGLQNSPIIIVGSFYAGSLAAWFGQKYPHLVTGIWSSSAPMHLKLDHYEYNEYVGNAFRDYGSAECYNKIYSGFKEMEHLASNGSSRELSEMFNLCRTLDTSKDTSLFFSVIADFYGLQVRHENDQTYQIPHICRLITNKEIPTDAEAVAKLWRTLLIDQCLDLNYDRIVQKLSNTNPNSEFIRFGERQRFYQTCSQIGLFHSTSSDQQPFGGLSTIEFFKEFCRHIFGSHFNDQLIESNVIRQNSVHGGLIPKIRNALFVHGSIDPWRSVGIQNDLSGNVVAIVIEGASQSKDIGSLTEFDSEPVIEAKLKILEIVDGWIENKQIK